MASAGRGARCSHDEAQTLLTHLRWIGRTSAAPYFADETGAPWTPIGHNDALTWPELFELFQRRNLPGVERHLGGLRAHGVTCLHLMLEYCHREHRYLERPVGRFVPAMVRLWDDLIGLCRQFGLRVLLTPFDTFFMRRRWRWHPYNRVNGGPCAFPTQLLTCPGTRTAVKDRLAFATERWGGDGVVFAWDLCNEITPVLGGGDPGCCADFIGDVGTFLRDLELRLHGRAHLQCVSVFSPELDWRPRLNELVFRHPALDFATSHFYEQDTIDDPRDTVTPAISTGRLMREALAQIADQRPFLDSEHGPIHAFKDRHRTLPEAFDDEYFRHMQWAHFASGGAGGGMRWPNRHPHALTPGMRRAQRALAGFLPLVDWGRFRRRNLNEEIETDDPGAVAAFGCGDAGQAVVWLLRRGPFEPDGRLAPTQGSGPVSLHVPGLAPGAYRVVLWDTVEGRERGRVAAAATRNRGLAATLPTLGTDLALAIRPV
jgi:mannan endo-1,4-beta-mannosidase